ncbi:hypothetical protein [Pseudoalteromonas peptidolytica]|uniref:Phage tail tape measure protein n=1 Tax=Pseudoalteromonas peptidolytica F12-50-A1 TaxID=1315280 RepID=A0A8I0T6H0_9GAMM|nr:hypothetical protein [Pseudoalteromonas peptidolytica]MBE0348288.1 hypothetical protein [Pseudoalteromonas peptidolytica F12-50-A1]NLR16572.1 hypothetical protein [Pseudoalteromonas peptidolytica]GEK08942.1 hypothetical protein PPE03_11910 [Pseudoalteromonas peptidolytica]
MSTLASLNIMLGANSAVLRRELTRAAKSTHSFVSGAKKQLGNLTAFSAKAGKKMGAGVAVGSAALGAGLVAMERTLKSIEDIRRQADNVSLPVEDYQAYIFATKAAGLEADQFGDVIKDLNAKVTDFAVSGGGALADFFAVTGEDVKEWQKLQPAEQFERFTKELDKMSESEARFWLDEINDSAAKMFGTLIRNKGEFAGNVKLAKDLGLVMSSDVVAGVQRTYREVNTLKAMLGGMWQHTIAAASPVFEYVSIELRKWLTDTANANGGFASLGKTIVNSILGSVQAGIVGVSKLFYEIQSASYKVIGEHNASYIVMTRNLRKLNNLYDAQSASVEELAESYQLTQKVLQEHEAGTRKLSATQQKEAKAFVRAYVEKLSSLGALGDQIVGLEQQVGEFEEQEGIAAPFKGALDTLKALKAQVVSVKVELGGVKAPEYTPPSQDNFKTAIKNPFESRLKQAEEYFSLKRLMRQNDWTEERAKLQLELNEYKAALDKKQLSDREYYMLKQQAEQTFQTQSLQQNQTFMQQLRAQVEQTTTDYQSMWGNTFDRFTQGIGQSVSDALFTQQSFSESMKGVLGGVVKSTVAALAEMGAKRLALWVLEKTLNKTTASGAAGFLSMQAQAMAFMAGLNAFASTAAIPVVGPAAAPAAMGAALAVAQPMASAIAGVSAGMVGMAHSGIDHIPAEGTWLLDKGERVYTNESVAKLDHMYDAIMSQATASPSGGSTVHMSLSVNALNTDHFKKWWDDNENELMGRIQSKIDKPL